ncbi:MAG: cob(I)yrinic acid a,c-diamide adenosyltransferase [Desulfovibrio sp.]|nr:cob(I)yrinic acid a,c-diamide adenosyltransferase [Desulfovibrio sp.]
MILVYTGEGKGKTSACAGQAIRALGAGLSVVFAQFMKRDGVAGEQFILKRLLGDDFRAGGIGFFRDENSREKQTLSARLLLDWVLEKRRDLVILDEFLRTLERRLLSREDIEPLLERKGDVAAHLVLSGARAPDWVRKTADLVTEMRAEKHYYRNGVAALPGLEF